MIAGSAVKSLGLPALLLALISWTAPARAEDMAPEAVVGELYQTLLAVMREGKDFAGRAETLEPVLDRVYNFPLMTRLAVGKAWSGAGDQTKDRVTGAFRRLSIATYANQFTSFDGEEFAVLGSRSTDSGDVVVATHIAPAGGEAVIIDYLIRRGEDGWRIADVYLTGTISELATKRSEFAGIIKSGGLEGLITALEVKADALAAF